MSAIYKHLEGITFFINLWKAYFGLLEQIGVKPNNINTEICTYIHHNEFYSSRYENNKCGRNINVIR